MKTPVKKVSKKQTGKEKITKMATADGKTGLPKSRFADKDFSRFAPVTEKYLCKSYYSDKYEKIVNCTCGKCRKPTAFPYEIDTEPIVQGCTKRQAMLIALAVAAFLVGTAYGAFEALTSNLIH